MDLFGESLIGDLLDTPTTIPSQSSAMGEKSSDVDLFGDADFVSAAPQVEAGGSLQTQVECFLIVFSNRKHIDIK